MQRAMLGLALFVLFGLVVAAVDQRTNTDAPMASSLPAIDTTPPGAIDASSGVGAARITGWIDADRVPDARVDVVVDGVLATTGLATISRPDAAAAHAADAVGFDLALPEPAAESICVTVTERGGERRGLGCRFVGAPTAAAAAAGGGAVVGSGGTTVRYSVEVGAGTGLDPEEAARVVDRILADERSWIGSGAHRFQRSTPALADVQIFIGAPAEVDRRCAPLPTDGYLSCRIESTVSLNADRWNTAVPHWSASLAEYRAYLVNHEVGHFLGRGHVGCPRAGAVAPVMLQQSIALDGCTANGWPYPASLLSGS